MKKLILSLIIIALCLVGCMSEEDKANELIKKELFKTLYDFESYEPIETIIDSSFTTIYRDSVIMSYAYIKQVYSDLIDEEIEEIKDIGSSMEVWVGSRSSYGRSKIKKLKERVLTSQAKFDTYAPKLLEIDSLILKEINAFTPSYVGIQAKHKFRAKNKVGNFTIGNYLYIFDDKLTKVISVINLDDNEEEKIQKIIDGK